MMILASVMRGFAAANIATAIMAYLAGVVFTVIDEIVYYIKRRW